MDVDSTDHVINGTDTVFHHDVLDDSVEYMDASPSPSRLGGQQGGFAAGDVHAPDVRSPSDELEGQGEEAFAMRRLQGVQEAAGA